METLQDAFFHELSDVLHAEKQLVKALPKMAKAATSTELRDAFEEHLEQTKNQVTRLEKVFELFDKTPKAKRCKGMNGLVSEGQDILKEDKNAVRDASLIVAAQKVEHYEIATYGSLCTWAKELQNQPALELLKENMAEEKAADEKLSHIAENVINPLAENRGSAMGAPALYK